MNGPDLFTVAIDARDRQIEHLRAALAAAEAKLALPAGPATIVGFPRFHRSRLVVNHVAIAGTRRVRFDCMAITAEGATLVLSSISEVHLRRIVKAHEGAGFVIEHRGDRRGEAEQSAGGAAG